MITETEKALAEQCAIYRGEITALRGALTEIMRVTGTSTLQHHIARGALAGTVKEDGEATPGRTCETCAHEDLDVFADPCCGCGWAFLPNWTPKTTASEETGA